MWLWLRHNVVYFFARASNFKHDHDSDNSDDDRVSRVPCHSGSGLYDEIDHVPYSDRANLRDPFQNAPRRRERADILRLKNPYCVVIVNIFFDDKIGARNGAQADLENIKSLLQNAGFESVHVYCDQRRNDTLEIMENISNSPEIGNHDGLVVFVSSHGKKEGFQAVDKKVVKVEEMTSRVNGKQCAGLRGKPKLFFISACRGNKPDPGVPGVIDADSGRDERQVPRIPTEADFLVCYSTIKGFLSHRRFTLDVGTTPDTGTWMISVLIQVFEERRKYEDIMQMLARVNSRVANMATSNNHESGMKQMPVQMHMLRHRVFFGKSQNDKNN